MSTPEQQVIPAAEVAKAASDRRSLLATFADKYGLEANNMMRTLRATVFRPNKDGVEPSNEQVAAFLIVANQHGLSPFTKEIHGFLDKRGGIVAIVGLDGWAKKVNDHPQFDGMDFSYTDDSCTCTMYRKDRSHPTVHTEWLSECKRPTEPWTTHPKRMLKWKALIQTARITFSFAGIYDFDEGEAIVAAEDAIDVTPGSEEIPASGKIGPKKLREVVDGMNDAVEANDSAKVAEIYHGLASEQQLFVWGHLRSWERSAIKKALDAAKAAQPAKELGPWAVETIKASATPEALETTWRLVEDAYAEIDQQVPLDIQTLHSDLKGGFGL